MSSAPRPAPPDKRFELEFWFEWSELNASHWRGKVRDHKVERAVADPEDAFDFVRHVLAQATPAFFPANSHRPHGKDRATAARSNSGLRTDLARRLLGIFRRGA